MSVQLLRGAALVALTAGALVAQDKPVELGLDGGLSYGLNDRSVLTFVVPVQSLRAGFFVTDRVSFEPAVALTVVKPEGSSTAYGIDATAGLLFHLSTDRTKSQAYIHPRAGITVVGGAGGSVNQLSAGGGIGVKVPMTQQFALRMEAGVSHGFSNKDVSANTEIFGLIGFSFFTR